MRSMHKERKKKLDKIITLSLLSSTFMAYPMLNLGNDAHASALEATIDGNNNISLGNSNVITGADNLVIGSENRTAQSGNVILGDRNSAIPVSHDELYYLVSSGNFVNFQTGYKLVASDGTEFSSIGEVYESGKKYISDFNGGLSWDFTLKDGDDNTIATNVNVIRQYVYYDADGNQITINGTATSGLNNGNVTSIVSMGTTFSGSQRGQWQVTLSDGTVISNARIYNANNDTVGLTHTNGNNLILSSNATNSETNVSGNYSIILNDGDGDITSVGHEAIIIGSNVKNNGDNNIIIGSGQVNSTKSIVVGGATVSGYTATAIGLGNYVSGDYAIGIGYNAGASEENAIAIGRNSSAYSKNSVSIGYGSTDGGENTVSVGSTTTQRKIVNVADGENDTDVATYGQLQALRTELSGSGSGGSVDISGKADVTGSNLSATNVASWRTILSDGVAVASGNKSLVDGDTLYNLKTDLEAQIATAGSGGGGTTVDITGKAENDASNLTDANVASWREKLSDGEASASGNTSLITGDTLYAVQSALDEGKADVDGSNLSASNVSSWRTILSDGASATSGNTSLITGDVLYRSLQASGIGIVTSDGEKISIGANDTATTISVLDSNGKTRTITGVETDADDDTSVVTVGYADDTYSKADASNLTNSDITAWQTKLGTGKNESGNKGLITGDTLYKSLAEFGPNLVKSDGSTIAIGRDDSATVIDVRKGNGDGRVIKGVLTDISDPTSAANVGYVNQQISSQMQGIGNKLNETNNRITQTDKRLDAVGAMAMASSAIPSYAYDPDAKVQWGIGVGSYNGQTGTAIGVKYDITEMVGIQLKAAQAGSEKSVGFGVGGKIKTSKDNHATPVSNANTATAIEANAKRINELMSRLESLTTEMNGLKAENLALKNQISGISHPLAG